MFQGSGTNQKTWNEHTKSKFLDRLNIIGSVYCYQDKTYNIWHYNKSFSNYKDYDMDIDIDLSYVRPDTHIKMVYDDIQSKYNIHSDSNDDNSNENMISILSGETYIINNDIINSINNNNIDKLTQYNDIILQLTGKNSKEIKKDTKLIEEIKLYLNKSEKEKLNKQIEESKSHQDTYINYIVSRLPLI